MFISSPINSIIPYFPFSFTRYKSESSSNLSEFINARKDIYQRCLSALSFLDLSIMADKPDKIKDSFEVIGRLVSPSSPYSSVAYHYFEELFIGNKYEDELNEFISVRHNI